MISFHPETRLLEHGVYAAAFPVPSRPHQHFFDAFLCASVRPSDLFLFFFFLFFFFLTPLLSPLLTEPPSWSCKGSGWPAPGALGGAWGIGFG